jgi:hypothetical protein
MKHHYQTGRGTLCSLNNDASVRTATRDATTVTCPYCLELLRLNQHAHDTHTRQVFAVGAL